MKLLVLLLLSTAAWAQGTGVIFFQTASGSTGSLPQAAAPTFAPDGSAGPFTSAQSVTISDTTTGATSTYCTSTTTCSPSTTYSSPVSITTTGTFLCAYATASGYTQSTTYCSQYTITTGGGGAVAYVQSNFSSQGSINVTTKSIVFPSATKAGNAVVVSLASTGSQSLVSSTTLGSVTLTQLGTTTAQGTAHYVSWWCTDTIAGGSGANSTVNVTTNGNWAGSVISIYEISGTVCAHGGSAGVGTATGTSGLNPSVTITPPQSPSMLLASVQGAISFTYSAIASPWLLVSGQNTTSASNGASGYYAYTGTAQQTATFTLSGSSTWAAMAVSFY